MTLPATDRLAGPYSCNGSVDDFDFAFKVFTTADIRVVKTSSAGVELVLVLDSDYTVVLNADQQNDPGGTVTTSSAYATGFTIAIDGSLVYSQTAELTNLGGFFPKVIERALDRLAILIQQLKKLSDRSLKLQVSSASVDSTIYDVAAGEFIRRKNDGLGFEGTPAVYDLGNYLASFTGAIARTASSKLNDIVTIGDAAAVNNGVADDTTKVQSTFTGTRTIRGMPSGVALAGVIDLRTDQVIDGGSYLGKTGIAEFFRAQANADRIVITPGTKIIAQQGYPFHSNAANVKNTTIVAAELRGSNGAAVWNQGSAGSSGFIVALSVLGSSAGDALTWNHPPLDGVTSDVSNGIALGNLLEPGNPTGMGVTIAGTKGGIVVANHVKLSIQEAHHVEDAQQRVIFGFNTALTNTHGIVILHPLLINPDTGLAFSPALDADGIIHIGNHYRANVGGGSTIGVHCVNDANGTLALSLFDGDIVRGFGVGYDWGSNTQWPGHNLAVYCDIGMRGGGAHMSRGEFLSKGCPVLAQGQALSSFGRLSEATDTLVQPTILEKLAPATSFPGPYCKGFDAPWACVHAGGGAALWKTVCPVPTNMTGLMMVTAGSGANGFSASAWLHWNGATLAVTSLSVNYHGTVTLIGTFRVDSGNLQIEITASAVFSAVLARADLTGIHHVD